MAIALIATLPLGLGWACGRIHAARALFNKTIDDARIISGEVVQMARGNKQVAEAVRQARTRARGRLRYDDALLRQLVAIRGSSPEASPEDALGRQRRLFQTNYAMMEGIAIERLFKYYNNTLRLMSAVQGFVQHARQSKALIESYGSSSGRHSKHGIIVAEDAGTHYRGQLVEVGNIVCADDRTDNRCPRGKIKGFYVRTGASRAWSPRAGKPGPAGRISKVVIPIIPDESWRQVTVARRGYLAYNDYLRRFGRVAAIAALLAKEEKSLKQDLAKAAGREKLYTLF